MTVTPLMGLWSGPMVRLPVTPAKSLVAARAWAILAPSQAAGLIHGRGQEEIAFAAQGGKGVQLFFIGLFVSLHELLAQVRGGPLAVEVGGEIHAVHRRPADAEQFRHLGPVAGEDGGLDPQVLELLGQQGVFGIVVGGIDEVGIFGPSGRKSGR